MDFLLFWIFIAFFVAIVASVKGRSVFGWFLLGFLFNIFAAVLVILMPSLKGNPTPDTHLICPDCAELVRKEAKVCKHCGCKFKSH